MRAALTRPRIVEAAWTLLGDEGLDAVSLRRIAGVLDVTAPALYAHIDGKDDLLDAIAEIEFAELTERTTAPPGASPLDGLRAVVAGYVSYAVDRPNAFQLLFRYQVDLGKNTVPGARHRQVITMFDRAVDAVNAGIADGSIRDVDVELTGFAVWALAHGSATGIHLGFDAANPEAVAGHVVDVIVGGLQVRS